MIRPAHRLDGAYAIAERVRAAIEAVRVPRFRSTGMLSITASVGVAASSDGHKVAPIAEADAGLYRAERQVKNCTVGASTEAAKVFSAE